MVFEVQQLGGGKSYFSPREISHPLITKAAHLCMKSAVISKGFPTTNIRATNLKREKEEIHWGVIEGSVSARC